MPVRLDGCYVKSFMVGGSGAEGIVFLGAIGKDLGTGADSVWPKCQNKAHVAFG